MLFRSRERVSVQSCRLRSSVCVFPRGIERDEAWGEAHLVLIVWVQVDAGSLTGYPLRGDRLVDIGLVYYSRDNLSVIAIGMVFAGPHDIGSWNGVDGSIFEKEGDKCAEGIYKKANNDEVNEYEDLCSFPHRNIW